MMPAIDLTPSQRKTLLALLRRFIPGVEVWAYGSRVKWTARPNSDLDLVAFSSPGQRARVEELKESLSESDLPFPVDLHVWDEVPERFREIIRKQYVILEEALEKRLARGPEAGGFVQLKRVCAKIGSGATPRGGKESYKGGATALIRSQNVYNEGFSRGGLVFIDDRQAAELNHVEVQSGDILLNITGDSVARCCQVPDDVLPARVNQHVAIIRPSPGEMDARFLRYVLVSPAFQSHLLALASAGATRDALTKGMIEDLEVPARSILEQKAIAEVLGALDDKIEVNRRMNATLEAMARALFQSWFVDFDPVHAKRAGRKPEGLDAATAALFPSQFHDSQLGSIPKTWIATTLEEVIEISDSKRIPLSVREREKRPGPYPYHGAAAAMDHVDDFLFDGIYVLMGEDGSVINGDGTPVLQYVWGKFWVNNHAHVLRGKNGVCTEHLLLHLKGCNIAPFVNGAVQPKLNQGNMKRIAFIRPPPEVCRAFAELIEPLFARFRANSDQSRTLAALRDTLLPKLLSGEVRVPASVDDLVPA